MPASPPAAASIATLICVYAGDTAPLLTRALDSVLDQAGLAGIDHRLYLHVDGPLDPALEAVLAAYQPRLHRLLRSQENVGLARGLNRLIDALEDEAFLFRMDADDVSRPDRYRRQLDYLQAHPDVDILGGAIREVTGGDEGEGPIVHRPSGHDGCVRILTHRSPLAHPAVCMRRRVFDSGLRYPLDYRCEDLGLWFMAVKAGFRLGNLDDVLVDFTTSGAFMRRRAGLAFSLEELNDYWQGIRLLGRSPLAYVLPLVRFGLRMTPFQRLAYRLRRRLWR